MRQILGMVMMLTGAAALPAAATVNGLASFPQIEDQIGGQIAGGDLSPILPLILAQSTGGEGSSSRPDKSDRPDPPSSYGVTPPDAVGISSRATAALVAVLATGTKQCEQLGNTNYNVDCLSYEMWLAAQSLPETGGYADARAALLKGAAQLHALAQANAAPGIPAAAARLGGKITERKLIPVKMTPKVAARAAAIVEETKLVLLRSSEGSQQRRTAYVQVAAIVGSTKVLLRSS